MRLAHPHAWLCIAAALAGLLVSSWLQAVEPQINDIEPFGFQRGGEVEVRLTGARLSDAAEALFYTPGITVSSWEASEGAIKAKLTVSENFPLGIHALRVRAESGISNLRLFAVGNLPQITEAEPNNLFDAPQQISLGTTVTGVVQTEDVDYFVVEAKKGDRIAVEVEGLRLGYTTFDPYVAILNEKRFELDRSDDAALLLQDCIASIVAPEDGKYIIQLRESSFGGDGNSKYRLHVGSFPRPMGVYPAGGRPGETLEIRCLGDVAGEFTAQVTLPTDGASEFPFYAQDEHGVAPSPNMMRVIDLPNVLEAEPNNTPAEATVAGNAPAALNGIIDQDDDVDYFRFTAKKGEQYDVRVYARGTLRSPLDPVLAIHNAQGGQIAANDDNAGSPDSYLRFAVPDDGDYLISVRDHLNAGGPTYVYRVEVTKVAPNVVVSLPERRQYIPTLLNVPRGNRMALMVAAQRQNFGGDLQLDLLDGPAGLTMEALPFTGGRGDVPVVFHAAADVELDGGLAKLLGKPLDDKTTFTSEFRQSSSLVRGQNNRDVVSHISDRMAVAITEEVPFRLEIVPPTAPLVRDGSLELKVVATREEGFNGPISIRMLYNPPGVASSGSVTIPADQTEGKIPLTANGNAPLATHKIVVLGTSGRSGRGRRGGGGGGGAPPTGAVECSSQLADLTVADAYYKLAFQKAAVELGQETSVVVKVDKVADYAGNAKIELVGLPAGTSAEPIEVASGTEELIFRVKSDAAVSKAGKYTSLVCRSTLDINGMTVVQNQGTGELRIDAPLPPRKEPVAAKPAPAAPVAVAEKPPEAKPLSRLEMLRQQKQEGGQ